MRVPNSARVASGCAATSFCRRAFRRGGQQRFASAQVGLRLQRAALLELLPDPSHGRDAKAEKLRNVAGAFALFIEVDDAFADRQGIARMTTSCHTITPGKATCFMEML